MYELKNKDKFTELFKELDVIERSLHKKSIQARTLIHDELQHILDSSDPSCGVNQIWIGSDYENLQDKGKVFVSFEEGFTIEDFYDDGKDIGTIFIYEINRAYDIEPLEADISDKADALFISVADFIRFIAHDMIEDNLLIQNTLIENGITVYRN